MLIELKDLISKYKLNIRGILHVGAHAAEEYESYTSCNINEVVWYEADPKQYLICLNKLKDKNQKIFNYAVYDKDGEKLPFNLSNNTQCSSLLNLKKHSKYYPEIVMNETIEVETKRLDTVIRKDNIDIKKYNFMNLDIQGAELYALKGLGEYLNDIDYIYTEVNNAELYENCDTIEALDKYLIDYGFVRIETVWTHAEWGDALYIKAPNIKVITTCYNNKEWLEYSLTSITNQTYSKYKVLFIDDASNDGSFEAAKDLVGENKNFTFIKHDSNKSKAYSFATYVDDFVEDEDIIIFIDSDDWLIDNKVFENVVTAYIKNLCWVAYGGMYCWNGQSDDVSLANPQNTDYPSNIHATNKYRLDQYRASHLKTLKGFLYKKIDKKDFKINNDWIKYGDDLIIMCSALEMTPTKKISTFNFPTYVYNSSNSIVERTVLEQKMNENTEKYIRNRTSYNCIVPHSNDKKISARFLGGLGNQLFEIAAAESFAKDNGISTEYAIEGGVYTMGHVSKYLSNILRNIKIVDVPIKGETYNEPYFNHRSISSKLENNILIEGHFQSEKYFSHNRDHILQLFSPTKEIVNYIKSKYSNLLDMNCVSLHVRRKEYKDIYKDHHRLCKIEYYQEAISKFPEADVFLVFSDEIDWCKENFNNDKFVYIENEEDYIDLYLMSMCKHNIIANSSFSWWAAWLNINENKKIVSPNPWFGPALANHNIKDLVPETWIKIENALI